MRTKALKYKVFAKCSNRELCTRMLLRDLLWYLKGTVREQSVKVQSVRSCSFVRVRSFVFVRSCSFVRSFVFVRKVATIEKNKTLHRDAFKGSAVV